MTNDVFDFQKAPSPFVEFAEQRAKLLSKKYRSIGHPLKYVYIDPSCVNYRTTIHNEILAKLGSKVYDICTIRNGDWDTKRGSTTDLHYDALFLSVFDHFFYGIPWEKTPLIDLKMDVIAKKGRVDNCTTRGELVKRYERLDVIFENIQKSGFKRQDQLEGGKLHDEMFVTIGRFGVPFLASGGNHRLAMAKILCIKVLPFLVMTRHESWQDAREEYLNWISAGNNVHDVHCKVAVHVVQNSFDVPFSGGK